jgi:hypothetical protein
MDLHGGVIANALMRSLVIVEKLIFRMENGFLE